MAIYNISSGHNPDGKVACGAVGLIKESTEARKIQDLVIKYLKAQGHTVYDCTVNNGTSANDVLRKIVNKCNAHTVDLDISIHFNAGANKSANGVTTGTEVLVYSASSKAKDEAQRICNAIAEVGFRNRGVKYRPNLYFLRKTKAPALLIEVAFVDDPEDVNLYNANIDKIARKIVKGITGVEPESNSTSISTSTTTPFIVRIIVDDLNIRAGAGTNYKVVGCITDRGSYTITKTSGSWGYLKSGAGWINISSKYAKRI